jgi:hypothetical protein
MRDVPTPYLFVPLKPFVKQYYLSEAGTADEVPVTSNSMLWQLVMLATSKQAYRTRKPGPVGEGREMLRLRLSRRLRDRMLQEGQQELLSTTLERYFYEQLYTHIRAQAAVHGSEYGALRCFMQVHHIDVEQGDIDKLYKNYRDRKATLLRDNHAVMKEWYEENGGSLAAVTNA